MSKLKKKCTKCNKNKSLDSFGKDNQKKDKLTSSCKKCAEDRYYTKKGTTKKIKKIYKNKKECTICKEIKELSLFGKSKQYKDNLNCCCKRCNNKKSRTYTKNNKDKISKAKKIYRKDNSEKINALGAKRRASRLNATPSWSEISEITKLYTKAKELEQETGTKYHVDHVIPLQSDKVCGLHVLANLQILEASENIKKGNKLK